ncbi:ABC transporter substrate-binding protein [Corynebacterium yudongzhengii]|nr:ABC transporter substrate-binding protein [Corynebacterium yudongzhengii]
MFKRLVLTGAIMLTGLLTACTAGHTATQVGRVANADIVVATTNPATSLDFTTTGGAGIPAALMSNVYETLVVIDDDGEIQPHLATHWDIDDAGTRYTFYLRDDVHFSNGEEFTAQTAAASIDNVLNNWTNGLASQMEVVDEARVVDKHTLEVDLQRPSQHWLWSMATLTGAMMTPSAMDSLAGKAIGTGPYTVERFVPGESISFAARPDYWGKPADHDAAIRYYPDAMSSVNALRTGDTDVVYGMQAPELLDTLDERYGIEVGTTNGEVLLSLNNDAAPFDDPRVRRAVAHAINREHVSEVVWEGLAADTGGAPVAPIDPWFTGKDYAPYDPELARELLREAGYDDDHRPQVLFKVPSQTYTENLSELVYSQLEEVGFDVELESIEFPALWLNEVMGAADYQMSAIAHVEPRDIPTLFGDPEAYLRYDSPEVRELLRRADTAAGPEEQAALMEEAVSQIMAETGSLTVANMPNIVLTAPGIEGVKATSATDVVELSPLSREDA